MTSSFFLFPNEKNICEKLFYFRQKKIINYYSNGTGLSKTKNETITQLKNTSLKFKIISKENKYRNKNFNWCQ